MGRTGGFPWADVLSASLIFAETATHCHRRLWAEVLAAPKKVSA